MSGLLEDECRTRDHRDALGHPGLSLDVGLLRIRSGVLVEVCLVRIIVAPDNWESLYTARVLLRVGAVER
jgi:hypothetical protein